jgi:hypothetical protein
MKLGIIIVVGICICLFILLSPERGHIIGEFVDGWADGYGEGYGEYPFTTVHLKNWTVDGDIYDHRNKFVFRNEYQDVYKFKKGDIVKINWHKESRQSDVNASVYGTIYILDNIETLYSKEE